MEYSELQNKNPCQLVLFLMSLGILLPEKKCQKFKRKCSLKKRSNVPEKVAWRCIKSTKFYSIKDGSFDKFKLPILKVIEIIDYWTKERNQRDMHESLKVSRPILLKICHYLRQLCYLDLDKENFKCGGPQKIVEIDESVFNKVKYKKGKDMVHYTKKKQLWVFGIRERANKKCLFQAVSNRENSNSNYSKTYFT